MNVQITYKTTIGERVRIVDKHSLFLGATGTIIGERRWGAITLFKVELDQAGHTQSWVRPRGTCTERDESGLEPISERER